MAGSRNVIAALQELLGTEQELYKAWGTASVSIVNGTFTAEARARFNTLREQLFDQENAVYRGIVAALPDTVAELIDPPTRIPALPDAASPRGLAGAGLGVLPPQAWAAIALIAIAEIAAVAYVAVRFLEIAENTIVRIYQIRSNTMRYGMELAAVDARFYECVRRGGDPVACSAAAPVPHAPLEELAELPTDPMVIGAAVLGLTLGVGGIWWVASKRRRDDGGRRWW